MTDPNRSIAETASITGLTYAPAIPVPHKMIITTIGEAKEGLWSL
ncbi:hypothetical protein HDF16_005077 [Granulicella aggregans]|uniref:Uncharacterized protein n=1 Tax=Granulicella aggregans TaxID=474949 RepID=A0A7W7ZJI7_9BACT|nr:hypothetical protein [Granulicella aggregans]